MAWTCAIEPSEAGSVAYQTSSMDSGSAGDNSYVRGERCTMTATPSQGYRFKNFEWLFLYTYSEDSSYDYQQTKSSNSTSYTFSDFKQFSKRQEGYSYYGNQDTNIKAVFEQDSSSLGIKVNVFTTSSPTSGGITTGGGLYEQGTTITISQTPAQGYDFVGWVNSLGGTEMAGSFTFTVGSSNIAWVAKYQKKNKGSGLLIWKDA